MEGDPIALPRASPTACPKETYNVSVATTTYLDRLLEPLTRLSRRRWFRSPRSPRRPEVEARIGELRLKANEGTLTSAEDAEYKDFVEGVDLISIIGIGASFYLAKRSGSVKRQVRRTTYREQEMPINEILVLCIFRRCERSFIRLQPQLADAGFHFRVGAETEENRNHLRRESLGQRFQQAVQIGGGSDGNIIRFFGQAVGEALGSAIGSPSMGRFGLVRVGQLATTIAVDRNRARWSLYPDPRPALSAAQFTAPADVSNALALSRRKLHDRQHGPLGVSAGNGPTAANSLHPPCRRFGAG